jgi:DNA-binding NarL/FixJ family response regulator
MVPPVQVLLAEYQAIVRDGLRLMLESEGNEFNVMAEAEDGREALQKASTLKPDLMLLDIRMPHANGTDVLGDIKRRSPGTKVIICSQYDTETYVHTALEAGADGYFVNNGGRLALFDAIRKVMAGEPYLSPGIQKRVLEGYRSAKSRPTAEPTVDGLSKRERAITKLVAEGKRNREIAEYLSLNERTIEKHRCRILKKLGLSGTPELIKYALEHDLV